jgi:hypothetical protein
MELTGFAKRRVHRNNYENPGERERRADQVAHKDSTRVCRTYGPYHRYWSGYNQGNLFLVVMPLIQKVSVKEEREDTIIISQSAIS